ncbi:MAG: lytic transglycosylase domain-containing protein [Lentisphaerae bacterium]|nr:lytic transglycosylase domain-containing protein [Lentisphaerota bacterium]
MSVIKKKITSVLVWILSLAVLAGALCFACFFVRDKKVKMDQLDDLLYNGDEFSAEIREAAEKYQLPPELVKALIRKESRFNPKTRGKAGEIGLMQILPKGAVAEWARLHKCKAPSEKELFEVKTNLDIGCWYLARAIKRWQDYRFGLELALADYNAGTKHAARWKPEKTNGEVLNRIDFPMTRKYVTDIMGYYREYILEKKR